MGRARAPRDLARYSARRVVGRRDRGYLARPPRRLLLPAITEARAASGHTRAWARARACEHASTHLRSSSAACSARISARARAASSPAASVASPPPAAPHLQPEWRPSTSSTDYYYYGNNYRHTTCTHLKPGGGASVARSAA